MSLTTRVYAALDHRWGRPVLGLIASARESLRHGRVRIAFDGTHWVHHYGEHVFRAYRAADHSLSKLDAETHTFFLWDYVPSAGETVVDIGAGIGAGIGTEAPTFSRCVGDTGRVLAVEAHPRVHATLVANVQANNLTNVSTLHTAVGSHDGDIMISNDLATHDANTTLVDPRAGVQVPCETLDSIVRRAGIEQIDLLKMNIEGAEDDALDSGRAALAITRHVCISCHDFLADRTGNEGFRTKRQVWAILEEEGFTLRSRPDATTPWGRDYVYGSR